jgi:hemoglobin
VIKLFSSACLRHLACLAILLAAALTVAQARAQVRPDDSLYLQLGGQKGLDSLVDTFTAGLLTDARTAPFFRDVDMIHFKPKMVTQLCQLSGGPCHRIGKDMGTVHAGQDITQSNFNAVVEVLQAAMDVQGIPFSTQNRMLATLAPLHRDIVNAH